MFNEVIRFNARRRRDGRGRCDPPDSRADADAIASGLRLAAHAPYSVAPAVFRAIRVPSTATVCSPCSVHLSESRAEVEFIKAGERPVAGVARRGGRLGSVVDGAGRAVRSSIWIVTAFSTAHVIAVHGVQMSSADLARLASRGTTLVTCPRSNAHTGAGAPPIEAFYASGVRVAVGTDSLASTPDLNMFAELAAMRALAPSVPASALLDSATRQGARALGFERGLRRHRAWQARAAARRRASGRDATMWKRYLVSGIQPAQVRWIPEMPIDDW